jgi:hypothetical protein
MIVRCESCCRVYDDAEANTRCPHYPIGTSAATFCKRCDLYKPCACAPRPLPPEQIPTPIGIGINEGEGSAREGRRLYERVVEAKRAIAEQPGTFKPTQREAEAAAAAVSRRVACEAEGADTRPNPMPAEPPENVIAYGDRTPGEHGRPPRTRRRFVTRGGDLVEVESVVRETRG